MDYELDRLDYINMILKMGYEVTHRETGSKVEDHQTIILSFTLVSVKKRIAKKG